jgi:hypothetical protein
VRVDHRRLHAFSFSRWAECQTRSFRNDARLAAGRGCGNPQHRTKSQMLRPAAVRRLSEIPGPRRRGNADLPTADRTGALRTGNRCASRIAGPT